MTVMLAVPPGLYKQLTSLRDLLSDVRGDPSTVGALKDAIAGAGRQSRVEISQIY